MIRGSAHRRHRHALWLLLPLALGDCRAAGQLLSDLLRERPPAPLTSIDVTSDARFDSTGHLLGSFVGEGTSRQVHLITTDTALIAELARRYRPPRARRLSNVWEWLSRQRQIRVDLSGDSSGAILDQTLLVGSPAGHTNVALKQILLFGSSCGWRGARAEFVIQDGRARGPSLRGPVLGSFRLPDDRRGASPARRQAPPEPSDSLVNELIDRTAFEMDSILTARLPRRSWPLERVEPRRIEINTLEDVDAADVIPFQSGNGRIRYAVALRERRTIGGGEPVLAATLMVWDSAGAWNQVVLMPTLLSLSHNRIGERAGWMPRFWRRVDAVDGFGTGDDYLWFEQVDVSDNSVLWTILQPRGNTVVAAAEVDGPCG